jgi:hypothetical protein
LITSSWLYLIRLLRSTSAWITIYWNWSDSICLLFRLLFSDYSIIRSFWKKFTFSLNTKKSNQVGSSVSSAED